MPVKTSPRLALVCASLALNVALAAQPAYAATAEHASTPVTQVRTMGGASALCNARGQSLGHVPGRVDDPFASMLLG